MMSRTDDDGGDNRISFDNILTLVSIFLKNQKKTFPFLQRQNAYRTWTRYSTESKTRKKRQEHKQLRHHSRRDGFEEKENNIFEMKKKKLSR